MAQTNKILEDVANNVVCKDNILDFLNIMVYNPHLSITNLALLYKQKPCTSVVCGRTAWLKYGRRVKDNAKPLVLYIPKISLSKEPEEFKIDNQTQVLEDNIIVYIENAEYKNNYDAVLAYDYNDTEITDEEIEKRKNEITPKNYSIFPELLPNFRDTIIEVTQVSTEFVENDFLNSKLYKYDKSNNTFYISEDITDDEDKINNAYIDLFIDYCFDTFNIEDKCLKLAVKYIIYKRYDLKPNNIKGALFTKLDNYPTKQKIAFLNVLNLISSSLIQDLEGYVLSFDETAFINDLIITNDNGELYNILSDVIETIDDDILKTELIRLQLKIDRLVDGYLDDLFKERVKHDIYTYPYTELYLDNTDYLNKDRQEYYGFIDECDSN